MILITQSQFFLSRTNGWESGIRVEWKDISYLIPYEHWVTALRKGQLKLRYITSAINKRIAVPADYDIWLSEWILNHPEHRVK